jgi:hypothetical protein
MTHLAPIDMDDDTMEEWEEEGPGRGHTPSQHGRIRRLQETALRTARQVTPLQQASKQTQHGKVAPVHIPALEVMPDLVHGIAKDGEEVASGGEAPNNKPSSPIMQDVQMAGIPETETPGRRSKRRAETVDESSMERAEEHSQSPPPSLLLLDDEVLNNLFRYCRYFFREG